MLECSYMYIEPYNESRLPILLLKANWVKVVTYVWARDHAHSRNAGNVASVWLPYTNMGKL